MKRFPTLVCSRQVSPACREVIVELTGGAKKKYPESTGRYLPVEGEHQRGRPVGSFDNFFNNCFDAFLLTSILAIILSLDLNSI